MGPEDGARLFPQLSHGSLAGTIPIESYSKSYSDINEELLTGVFVEAKSSSRLFVYHSPIIRKTILLMKMVKNDLFLKSDGKSTKIEQT